MNRRQFLGASLIASASSSSIQASETDRIFTRPIPSSAEALPVVGLGTWQTFDVGLSPDMRAQLGSVLQALVNAGGSVVDSSPMYGRSETVVGELARDLGITDKLFMATKVWTTIFNRLDILFA